jgi:restriction endonuclease Mrr
MIEYNVGVSTVDTIAIKKIDSDYFNIEWGWENVGFSLT